MILVDGEQNAKRLLVWADKPAYMCRRLDLGVDVWEVGTVRRNYEAKV